MVVIFDERKFDNASEALQYGDDKIKKLRNQLAKQKRMALLADKRVIELKLKIEELQEKIKKSDADLIADAIIRKLKLLEE